MAPASAASPGAVTSSTEPSSAAEPDGGSNSSSRRRLSPAGRTAAEGGERRLLEGHGPEGRRRLGPFLERSPAQAGGQPSREVLDHHGARQRLQELLLRRPKLELVDHEEARSREPRRIGGMSGRGLQHRDRIGEPAPDALLEAAAEPGQGEQALPVLARPGLIVGERGHPLRCDSPPAEGHQRLGQGPGQGRAGQVGAHGEAVRAVQEAPREEGCMAPVPGPKPLPQEGRLRESPREVLELEGIDPGQGTAGGREPPRQLPGGGLGWGDEKKRPHVHRRHHPTSTLRPPGTLRRRDPPPIEECPA